MRGYDQAVELLVRGVCEREHRPVAGRALVIGLDLDASNNAVCARCGRHLEILTLVVVYLHRPGQIERHVVARDLDRLHGEGWPGGAQKHYRREDEGSQRS